MGSLSSTGNVDPILSGMCFSQMSFLPAPGILDFPPRVKYPRGWGTNGSRKEKEFFVTKFGFENIKLETVDAGRCTVLITCDTTYIARYRVTSFLRIFCFYVYQRNKRNIIWKFQHPFRDSVEPVKVAVETTLTML